MLPQALRFEAGVLAWQVPLPMIQLIPSINHSDQHIQLKFHLS
jgi:hypothetical protein